MMACMGVRVTRRALHEGAFQSFAPLKTINDRVAGSPSLLLIGPASLADTYLRDVARSQDRSFTPVGIVGLDARDVGQQVRGVCIIDSLDNLDAALTDLRRWNRYPRAVLFLEEPARLKGLTADHLGRLKNDGVRLLRLPSIVELAHHDALNLVPMREINIEELLAREPIELDRLAIGRLIHGKRVLITGAGGSIGSELCRQVSEFGPAELVMLDHDESNLHRMQMELQGEADLDSDSVEVADIRDAERIHQIFCDRRPEIVFHAAALKHLPVLERHPCEGVKSNVRGTENLVEAAVIHEAERFVLVSTDKAANPTSVLGATKRLAELLLMNYQRGGTVLASVRFGNVLGSRGSLLQVVREQLALGTPVTVTHPDMTRFFMTIEEAVGLVIESARMADMTATYVLDMGESVRIVDLIRNFATQLNVDEVPIRYTGLRPGEKLDETLFSVNEDRRPTAHPRIHATVPRDGHGVPEALRGELPGLYSAAWHDDATEVRRRLARLLPGFPPPEPARPDLELVGAVPYPDDF
jgi:O-antigen biosynthesis protein WbqV